MHITVKQTSWDMADSDALVVGVTKDATSLKFSNSTQLDKICRDFLAIGDFKGKLNDTALIYPQENFPIRRILFVGLGEREKYDLERMRQAAGTAAKKLMQVGLKRCTIALEAFIGDDIEVADASQTISEGLVLATYKFNHYKEPVEEETSSVEDVVYAFESPDLEDQVRTGIERGYTGAIATNRARDLQNHPGNWATPTKLAEIANEMALEVGLKCEVLDDTGMKELNMGALLAVAKGSVEPPKFIILEHNWENPNLDTIVFVGKGITFDSGGISIKPSANMEEMKFDMSGGAAVIATMQAVAQLDLPLHVVGLVPAAENLPSGSSIKPGDIVRASSGKTIEIINTDAEGRLVLADALVYAKRYRPKAVIDLATLTGACVVALGHHATGLFGTDADLIKRLRKAGEKSGERVWELPLWEDYQEEMKSDFADLKNSGGRWGGAITAAAFLANFAEGYPWAHLDIAGTAWTDKENAYVHKGGTGVGVRLLIEFLTDWTEGHTLEAV